MCFYNNKNIWFFSLKILLVKKKGLYVWGCVQSSQVQEVEICIFQKILDIFIKIFKTWQRKLCEVMQTGKP